jgi:hypothetical protein
MPDNIKLKNEKFKNENLWSLPPAGLFLVILYFKFYILYFKFLWVSRD